MVEGILSRLQEGKNSQEAVDLINSLLDGPKSVVFFDNADDAQRSTAKIPYSNREGTIKYGRTSTTLSTCSRAAGARSVRIGLCNTACEGATLRLMKPQGPDGSLL